VSVVVVVVCAAPETS